ncbi:hypothetical protein JCM8097_007776 [Rhodosporidiobolus ruineniae]
MAAATSSASTRTAYRRPSQEGQRSEPPDFDPHRPASSLASHPPPPRRPSLEQALARSRSASVLADNALTGGVRRTGSSRDLAYGGGGYRPVTPEVWERELALGEEARGTSARRRSEDAGPATASMRKGSATSLRREVAEAALPSTPRRVPPAAAQDDEEEELTPRARAEANGGNTGIRPETPTSVAGWESSSRRSSGGARSGVIIARRQSHTPPTMFPGGMRSSSFDASIGSGSASGGILSRSSSRAILPDATSSSSNPSSDLLPSAVPSSQSRSSSPTPSAASSTYSHHTSSASSSAPDDWAASHLPSGSSPPRSPLLAEIAQHQQRQARSSSLVGAAAALASSAAARESRPVSEFDFAAAYANSDGTGSVPPSPAVPAGFAMTPVREKTLVETEAEGETEGEGAPMSPPLPPLPPKKDDDADEEEEEEEAHPLPPPPPPQHPHPVPRPILALQTPLPASPSVTASSASPTSAVSTVGPLPPAVPSSSSSHLSTHPTHSQQHEAHLHPRQLASSASVDSLRSHHSHHSALSTSGADRPPSRSSTRSPGPAPSRPPRRQPSALSLNGGGGGGASQKSGVSSSTATAAANGTAQGGEAAEINEGRRAEEESTTSPTEPPAASILSSLSLAPETTTLEAPRARPRAATTSSASNGNGLSSVAGSVKSRGPPPNIPEKSRRRTSALFANGTGAGRRASIVGGSGGAGGGGGTGSAGPSPGVSRSGSGEVEKGEGGEGKEDGEGERRDGVAELGAASGVGGGNRFSTFSTLESHLRDSFYDTYASANYPPSPVPASASTVTTSTSSTSAPLSPPPSSLHVREPSVVEDPPSPVPAAATALPPAVDHLGSDAGLGLGLAPVAAPLRSASALSARSLGGTGEVERAVSPALSLGSASGSGRSGTPTRDRSDAKARAAAFIADLKKAKKAAAAAAEEEARSRAASEAGSPVVERATGGFGRNEEAEEDDTLVISAVSPSVVVSPSLDSPSPSVGYGHHLSTVSSPQLPSLPSSPPLPIPDSPVPPLRINRSGSTFTTTTARPVSSPPLPPFPPQAPQKRPSQSSILTTSSLSGSQPRPSGAAFSPPTRSASLHALPPLPVTPSQAYSHALAPLSSAQTPLLRRRPLPPAIQISGEIKAARTPRERARIYAEKINELARERSRLEEWVGEVRDVRTGTGRTSVPASPAKALRGSRQESSTSSTATFAPRPGDTYRAREITSSASSFGPKDLVPRDAPYPGVLGKSGGGSVSGASGKSFFAGLGRGSLGRRHSKRDHPTPHPAHHAPASSALSHAHHGHGHASPPNSSTNTLRITSSSISAPIAITSVPPAVSAMRSLPISGGAMGLNGPRMPNPTPPARHRASFDSRTSSPSGSPVLERDRSASRASFSYGTSASRAGGGDYASSPLVYQAEDSPDLDRDFDPAAEGEKLGRLADILPQAERADLEVALRKAGGDDVLAISVYLSGEAAKR